jgi:plastocyanin
MMRTTLAAIAAATVLTLLAACGGGRGSATEPAAPDPAPPQQSGPPAASADVSIQSTSDGYGGTDNSFSPASVRVARGGTVTWHNGTGVTHNVTFGPAAGAPENVPSHASGENARTFGTAGSFSYRCTIHAGMTGVVAVE